MDIDDKVAFLSELFPNQSLEFILNSLLKSDGDFDVAMNLILQDSDDAESMQYNSSPTAFDHLVNTFPSVEIESIEAFLLINDHLSDQKDLDLITREFMKHQSTLPKSPRDRNLTMKLSDFNSLLRTSNDLKKIPNQQTYLSSSSICYSHSFTCKTLDHEKTVYNYFSFGKGGFRGFREIKNLFRFSSSGNGRRFTERKNTKFSKGSFLISVRKYYWKIKCAILFRGGTFVRISCFET